MEALSVLIGPVFLFGVQQFVISAYTFFAGLTKLSPLPKKNTR